MPRTLLGVDGGGTRTRAVLLQTSAAPSATVGEPLQLRELGRGEAASCNHFSVGPDAALKNLLQAASRAFAAAGIEPASALHNRGISWGLGLAGAVSPPEIEAWRSRLQFCLAPGTVLRIGEDTLAAQSGAFAGGPGAILIAGTGANAFGRNAQGHTARADGLGPLLGDRGSGFWIGQQALRATACHHDGVATCPILHDAVLAALDAPDALALVPLVYAPAWTKDQVAALVPVVSQAAASGEEPARAILQAAGMELAHSAHAVLRTLQLEEVALLGGVLNHVPLVRAAFEAALHGMLPGARTVAPRHEADVGAALLALAD